MLVVHKKEEEKNIEIKLGDLFEDFNDGSYYILSETLFREGEIALICISGVGYYECYPSIEHAVKSIEHAVKYNNLKHYSSDKYELRLAEME